VLVCSEGNNPRKLAKTGKRETVFTVVANIWSLALDGTEIPLKASQDSQL